MIDTQNAWDVYSPSAEKPWTRALAGHLYRRAAFGGTQAELDTALKVGPQATIDLLIHGGKDAADFDTLTNGWADRSAAFAGNPPALSSWWVHRMRHSPHPLAEKMTLFWHNHFATSDAKVANPAYMLGQYRTLYAEALGNFRTLLQALTRDPAMLVWLDTTKSVKGMPNENYARELMELFSLGIGNYTEPDIREAAKAFTGFRIEDGKTIFDSERHDAGTKTVFGKKGNWKPEEIVNLCLDKPACARFIVRKLYRYLIDEAESPPDELIAPLAREFAKDYAIGKLVERMLRSNLFFSERAYRRRIKSPVDFVVGIARALEAPTGATQLHQTLQTLGQDPFRPPSVKGWDGGRAWLNAQTLLARQNFALKMCETRRVPVGTKESVALPVAIAGANVDAFLRLFLQDDVPPATRDRLTTYAKRLDADRSDEGTERRAIALCHLTLTLPEFQLD